MLFSQRRAEILTGALFGAWLGGTYALISQAVNWLFLPGIPLGSPSGSFPQYLFEYLITGALIGAISALADNRLVGAVLGGVSASALLNFRTLSASWGQENFGGSLVLVLIIFLPLVVLMMPFAFFIRLGVDARQIDPDRPYLWPRRYLIPVFLTLLTAGLGCLSLYSAQARDAFRYTDQMIQQGMIVADSQNELPEPLRAVEGFRSEARGAYTLMWSDRADTFFGPRPAGSELSQFLIITRFENGFVFACVFSENRPTPNCTNY